MWWQKTKGVCEKIPLITNETEAHYSGNAVSLSHLRVTVITALLQMYQKVQSNQKTQEHF